MDENTRASYLADLDFFQSKLEETSDSNLYFPVAAISARLGEYDEVIAICNEGLKTAPNFMQLSVLLAEAYVNVGRKDEAKEMLYEIITPDEDNYKALKLMGMIYKSDGDIENALRFFRTAYLKAPEDTELFGWLDEMGGFPISGTSGQIIEDTSEFGDFDTDFAFSVDMGGALESAKAAMDDLLREISGKGSAESKEKEEKHVDAFSGKEISDDEILSALGLASAAALTNAESGIAEKLPDAEEFPEPPELPELPELADLATFPGFHTDDFHETLPDESLISAAERPPAGNAGLDAFLAAAADFSPVGTQTLPEAGNDEVGNILDKALADAAGGDEAVPDAPEAPEAPEEPVVIPVAFDDDAAPVRPAGITEGDGAYDFDNIDNAEDDDDYDDDDDGDLSFESLAKLAPLDMPDAPIEHPTLDVPIAPEDVVADIAGEDEFAKALDSFGKLERDSQVPKLEEDERLVPFVPESLVDEVFAESGLDMENPYLDDEPIDLDALNVDKIVDSGAAEDEVTENEIIHEDIHDDKNESDV